MSMYRPVMMPEEIPEEILQLLWEIGRATFIFPKQVLRKMDIFGFSDDTGERKYARCKDFLATYRPGEGFVAIHELDLIPEDEARELFGDLESEEVVTNYKHAVKLRKLAKKLEMYEPLRSTVIPEILKLAEKYEGGEV